MIYPSYFFWFNSSNFYFCLRSANFLL